MFAILDDAAELVTLDALHFYQRRGFRLVGLHPGAIERGRTLEPLISRPG